MKQKKEILTGGVMAGGKSSRMGTDKGLQIFRGKHLFNYPVETLKPFCKEILISSNNLSYHHFNYTLVKDIVYDCGPIGGLLSLLIKMKNEKLLLIACDMPFVSSETIKRLLDGISDAECIIPVIGEKIEPLCAVYSKSLIQIIEKQIETGDFSLHKLIFDSSHKLIHFEDDIPDFLNINTPEEFNRYNSK